MPELCKEKAVSVAFVEYCANKGLWAKFRLGEEIFVSIHGSDPVAVWKQMLGNPASRELAIMLLQLTSHQGGYELKKLDHEKMCKVGAHLRREHMKQGQIEKRTGRKNHDEVAQLAVPRYAEALDGDVETGNTEPGADEEPMPKSTLVTSSAAGRRDLARWRAAAGTDDSGPSAVTTGSRRNKNLFPRSLALLFGGSAKRPVRAGQISPAQQPRVTRWSKEQLY